MQADAASAAGLMAWFDSEASLRAWGGPNMRYPMVLAHFLEDIRITTLTSYHLLDSAGELVAFGQYYLREGRCHLGRLAVSPQHRRQGHAQQLIAQLVERGCAELQTSEVSLFVMADNLPAVNCYLGLGFVEASYPSGDIGIDNCLYLVAPAASIASAN